MESLRIFAFHYVTGFFAAYVRKCLENSVLFYIQFKGQVNKQPPTAHLHSTVRLEADWFDT